MKHSRSNKKCGWAVLLVQLLASLFSSLPSSARPNLYDLDIKVVLSKNGDARITETRSMSVDSEGTECFIALGIMGSSTILDLAVSDETGRQYENIGEWDVDRSRSWKEGKCGIITASDHYELCWGLGDSGERTYITSYTITSLVHGYSDANAIRHVFIDQSVRLKPDHAKITIMGDDPSLVFSPDTCGIWGFRFHGDMSFQDGTMVAETTEQMNSEAAIYVMARFPKEMFTPSIQEDDTFEHKKEQAFEGSDYGDGIEESSFSDDVGEIFTALGILGGMFAGVVGFGVFFLKIYYWLKRRKHKMWVKSIDYCRTIPMEGNLQQANDMLNAYNYGKDPDYKRLISATVMQLIHVGAFNVKPVMTDKGKMEKRFVVNEMPAEHDLSPMACKMHEIFTGASGEDKVLDPHELETFMDAKANKKAVRSFVDLLRTKRSVSYYKNRQDEVREVFGFKKFLDDFTLMNERHMTEVQLWRDYMVWATLYGNANQVVKDMKSINPEFFSMDQLADQMADNIVLPLMFNSIYHSTDRMINEIERNQRAARSSFSSSSRSWGGGGHSSWGGGGGGFSGGGGFGGGAR